MLGRLQEGVNLFENNGKKSTEFNFTMGNPTGVRIAEQHNSYTMSELWKNVLSEGASYQNYKKDPLSKKRIDEAISLSEEVLKYDLERQFGKDTSLKEFVNITSSGLSVPAQALVATTAVRHRFLEEQNSGGVMNTVPSYLYAPLPTIAVTMKALQESVFQDLLYTFPMAEYQSALYLLSPKYGITNNGVTAGTDVRTSDLNGYASPQRKATITPQTSQTQYTLSVSGGQLEGPFYQNNVTLVYNNQILGTIGPEGTLQSYPGSTNSLQYFTANMSTGSIAVEFAQAPQTSDVIYVLYNLNFQDSANFDKLGAITMAFQRIPFQWMEFPISIEVAMLPELMYSTTMNVQLTPMLVETTAKEIARSLDFIAAGFINGLAFSNGSDKLTFDVLFRDASTTYISNPMAWRTYIIRQFLTFANTQLATKNKQGAVTEMWGSLLAMQYFTMSEDFISSGRPAKDRRGAFYLGSVQGVQLYAYANAESSGLGFKENRIFYKYDDPEGMNVSSAMGIYSLFLESQKIQNKNFVTTQGAMSLADLKAINPSYMGYIDLENYDPKTATNNTNW